MSKRLTETNKWDDPWFCDLSANAKLVWTFVCDRCDLAGVWQVNRAQTEFLVKAKLDWNQIVAELGDRIVVFENGGKWLLRKFIQFQFPRGLNRACKPHVHVFRLIEKHGISLDGLLVASLSGVSQHSGTVTEPLPKGYLTVQDKDQEQDKDQDKEKDRESAEREILRVEPNAAEQVITEPAKDQGQAFEALNDEQLLAKARPHCQWKTKDPERTDELRELLIGILRRYGRPALAVAEELHWSGGGKVWPDALERELHDRLQPAEPLRADFTPKQAWDWSDIANDALLTVCRRLIRAHGWEHCGKVLEIHVVDEQELREAIGSNRPLGELLVERIGEAQDRAYLEERVQG